MKIYWSDREGNPAPADAKFYCYPFASGPVHSIQNQVRELPSPTQWTVVKQTLLPDKKEWIQKVETALDLIHRNVLQKVLLARICILELATAPNPFAITAAIKQKAQNAHVFCMASKGEAFLGASPERLFSRQGLQITSEAMAGTRRRGRNPIEDEKLKAELLVSPKDILEFSFVKEHLEKILPTPSFLPMTVRQTHNVQHLYSRCSATLTEPIPDQELLLRLHPTPALCGTPREMALATISQLEPFERGLYGGVIGWTTPDASDWVVAIRSCHLKDNIATLYSGVGIVAGSNPEDEWDELNQKIKLYNNIY